MLSGFNTNFRYRGVLFHVQTEDSGLENPHVISHLFHGGNIMASEKRDYSDLIAEYEGSQLEDAIRKMMEGQHKSMLKKLSRGEHDPVITQRMGPDVFVANVPASDAADPPSVTEEERPPAPAAAPAPQRIAIGSVAIPSRVESTILEAFTPAPSPAGSARSSRLSRVFGDRVVSDKPLDEVVLDYLVENARKRRRTIK